MGFIRSIILLIGVCLCLAFAFFFGHALSTHETSTFVWGTVLLLAGAAVLAGLSRDRVHW
ncbi:MAG: hypothetical protein KFH98_10255 [Gemmatimonadetes bacterium]|nr:hypothetical protein [Gemmatimonadota bacterium]